MRRYWKGHYLREFGDEAIEAFVSIGQEAGRGGGVPLPSAVLQSYGGAIAEVDTPMKRRSATATPSWSS